MQRVRLFRHPLSSRGRSHLALLAIALTVLTCGAVLTVAASQTTLITAERAMSDYWRTSYDILVRPAGSRSPIEEKYGMVEANHLSGLWGGITFEQYEAIRSIPGVDVAAPIAMLGYVPAFVQTDDLGQLTEPGAYVVEETLTEGEVTHSDFHRFTYFYVGPDAGSQSFFEPNYPIANHPIPVSGFFAFSFLMAGIDLSQEAGLAGLDRALLEGEYLTNEAVISTSNPYTFFPDDPQTLTIVPALVNNTNYVRLTLHAALKRLALPPEVSTLQAIMERGAIGISPPCPEIRLQFKHLTARKPIAG
jgi:hypothetical protein